LAGAGCQPRIPPEALQLTQESLAQRQLQTRHFDTGDEILLLQSSAAVLQDLGFNVDESETGLGVVVGSKDRDATEAGQVAAAVAVGILLGAHMPVDRNQRIRASLVTRPAGNERTTVRVTFQRQVWNTDGQLSKAELIDDAQIYQEFFDRLSQSVFLTANEV
jgi:hypothetical protein